MKKDCECSYCKNEVHEYFCSSCFLNFNECESFHKIDGVTFCPRCHPENDIIPEFVKLLSNWATPHNT